MYSDIRKVVEFMKKLITQSRPFDGNGQANLGFISRIDNIPGEAHSKENYVPKVTTTVQPMQLGHFSLQIQ
jgi:hypothetical protein